MGINCAKLKTKYILCSTTLKICILMSIYDDIHYSINVERYAGIIYIYCMYVYINTIII